MRRKYCSVVMLCTVLIASCSSAPKQVADPSEPVITEECTLAVLRLEDTNDLATDKLRSDIFKVIQDDHRINVHMVERSQLDRIFEQHDLQNSGAMSGDQLIEFGKLLKVDYVVIGSFGWGQRNKNKPPITYALDARLVNVETAEIMSITSLYKTANTFDEVRPVYMSVFKQAAHELLYR